MKRIAVYLVSLLLMIPLSEQIYAAKIILKSGEVVEGSLKEETEDSIVVEVRYGNITISKDQIADDKKDGCKGKVLNVPKSKEAEKDKKRKVVDASEAKEWMKDITSEQHLKGMYKWLESQRHEKTGILESFRPTSDVYLQKQASTYDQALAGLAFLVLGDQEGAKKILEFFTMKWDGKGFSNFYYTPTGNSGLEGIAHLGPNMWIALLAIHYDRITKTRKYTDLALSVVEWAIDLPHYYGGAAMSDRDEWRAKWTKVVSTENNIDYYAVLDMLIDEVRDIRVLEKIKKEREGVKKFLSKVVCDKTTGGVFRGFHEGKVDKELSLDTVTWLVAAVGLDELREWKMDPEKMLLFAEEKFFTKDREIKGFDFTDKDGAFKAKRSRMISIEWSFGMVNLYCIYGNNYRNLYEKYKKSNAKEKAIRCLLKANICDNKARFYMQEMDKRMLRFGTQTALFTYPYATRSYWLVFYDSPWWRTPKANASGIPAGSVASVAWRIFAGRFNPLSMKGDFW